MGDGRRALSAGLRTSTIARLVQGLARAVISAAACASPGSKPPAYRVPAARSLSSPALLFNPARHRVRAICAAGSWGGQGWSVRRHPGDAFAAFGRFCSRCRSRCGTGWSTATRHRRLAPRLAFRPQGRGHLAARLPRRGPGTRRQAPWIGQDRQPIAPQVIGGHPVRIGLRAPGQRQQRHLQPARGRGGDLADRTAHASLIASSISSSITLIPSGMPVEASTYPEPRHGTSQEVARRTTLSRWLLQAGERKSRRSSGHGQSSGAVYSFRLGSARTESFVKLTSWSGPAGQGQPLPSQNSGRACTRTLSGMPR